MAAAAGGGQGGFLLALVQGRGQGWLGWGGGGRGRRGAMDPPHGGQDVAWPSPVCALGAGQTVGIATHETEPQHPALARSACASCSGRPGDAALKT